jgi:hypothetical protein
MRSETVRVSIQGNDNGDVRDDVNCRLALFAASCVELSWSKFEADRFNSFPCTTLPKKRNSMTANIDNSIRMVLT